MCPAFEDMSLGSLSVRSYELKVCGPPRSYSEAMLHCTFGGDLGHAGGSARRLASLQKRDLERMLSSDSPPGRTYRRSRLQARERPPLNLTRIQIASGTI